MKKPIQLLTLFLISLSSCEINQESEPDYDPMVLDEVREVLKREFYTPEGKLKSIDSYQYDFENYAGRQDWYYDESGKVVLTLGTNENGYTFFLDLVSHYLIINKTALIFIFYLFVLIRVFVAIHFFVVS